MEQAKRDAAEYAGLDSLRRDAMELNSQCQLLLSQADKALKAAGKQIDKGEKKQIKGDWNNLSKCLAKLKVDRVTAQEIDQIKQAKMQLEASAANLLANYSAS